MCPNAAALRAEAAWQQPRRRPGPEGAMGPHTAALRAAGLPTAAAAATAERPVILPGAAACADAFFLLAGARA